MNAIQIREQSHPPISAAALGLLDRAARHAGLALIQWSRRSELARRIRLEHRRERAARYHQLERLRAELAHDRAKLEAYALFGPLR